MIEFIESHRGKPICQTFKDLAARTWNYLAEGTRIGMPPGEETLTDENLMAILALHASQVAIWRFSKRHESQVGADWEWWLGNPSNGWFGMRVQAKKLDLKQFSSYSGVDHPDHTNQQLDSLIRESQKAGLFPAYCLYNTHLPHRLPVYGCSITSAQVMGSVSQQPQARRSHSVAFKDIERYLFPWHQLVCHPETSVSDSGGFPNNVRNSIIESLPLNGYDEVPEVHPDLPDYARKLVAEVTSSSKSRMPPTVDIFDLEFPYKYLIVVSNQPIFPRYNIDERNNF